MTTTNPQLSPASTNDDCAARMSRVLLGSSSVYARFTEVSANRRGPDEHTVS